MVGIVEESRFATTQWLKNEGRAIILLGSTADDLGASCYAIATLGEAEGRVPSLDLDTERRLQEACLTAIEAGLIESAHDCSDGGLAVAIAEACFSSYGREAIGCQVNFEGELSQAALMFAETPSRIIVSTEQRSVDAVLAIARERGVAASVIGQTGGDRLVIRVKGETVVDRSVSDVEAAWRGTLPSLLEVSSLIAAEEGRAD
jgi:phosphoribosylformylglycinamidine synthase